jgi:hypothetical protein
MHSAWPDVSRRRNMRLHHNRPSVVFMSEATVTGLHHVQLAIPPGTEGQTRRFYGDLTGSVVMVRIDLGVEEPFTPARKAHPGVLVLGIDRLAEKLSGDGIAVEWDDNHPGHRRVYAHDPYGNRLEFPEPL